MTVWVAVLGGCGAALRTAADPYVAQRVEVPVGESATTNLMT